MTSAAAASHQGPGCGALKVSDSLFKRFRIKRGSECEQKELESVLKKQDFGTNKKQLKGFGLRVGALSY